MKRLLILFISLVFASLCAFAKDVKILTIGNSFSASVFEYFPKIVEDFPDCKLTLGSANHGGCSLDRHWKYISEEEADPTVSRYNKAFVAESYCSANPTAKSRKRGGNRLGEILKGTPWDFVTIQQQSGRSWQRDTYYPFADNVYAYVKKNAPKAEVIVHQTWSYRCDDPRIKQGGVWGIDQTEMFKRAEANYAELAKKYNLRVVPTGLAVQNYRAVEKNPFKPYTKEYLTTFKYPNVPSCKGDVVGRHFWKKDKKDGKLKLRGDYIHLNEEGKYMQACLWFGFFFEKDPIEIKFVPKQISPEDAKLLREIASKTLKEFKQPRDSK